MILYGDAIRQLVDKLPTEVFDYICDEIPWLIDGLTLDKTQYIHYEKCDLSQLLEDNDCKDYEELLDQFYIQEFDDGFLIIE